METDKERNALLAKGRLLFDSCTADNGYTCVLGYIDHNLALGGWRAEAVAEFIEWMKKQRHAESRYSASAAAILLRLEERTD
jgi:hypothetical protein